MTQKIIVTSGEQFTDIDAYACAIAYSELLNLIGKDSEVILPGVFNSSITRSVASWHTMYKKAPSTDDAFYVLVDVSDKDQFSGFVKQERIAELYDHRYGFEQYWESILGKNSHIEMVGSCATLIWERYKKSRKESEIDIISANLLLTAIISNTLNFLSSVTTDRDQLAFNELKQYVRLPDNWSEMYYKELDSEIENNIEFAIRNDTKKAPDFTIGQLEMWNSKDLINNRTDDIKRIMATFENTEWFLTSPSISEGINYILATSENTKKILTDTIGAIFEGNIGKTDKLWLRKEIRKEISNVKNNG